MTVASPRLSAPNLTFFIDGFPKTADIKSGIRGSESRATI